MAKIASHTEVEREWSLGDLFYVVERLFEDHEKNQEEHQRLLAQLNLWRE